MTHRKHAGGGAPESREGDAFVPQSVLFEPLSLGRLELANRIVIAPMCQYSADNGRMTDWHLIHLGQLAISGAALLILEATAVLPEGRISYADVGLWDRRTESAMQRTLERIRPWSDMPLGIQLSHAGRKASVEVPWKGGIQLHPQTVHGWQTSAPSAIPYANGQHAPHALGRRDLRKIRTAFAAAAVRAVRIGIDLIEVHAAHGYLLHQFLSPLSNHRSDEYGGSLENRMRFPLEVFDTVRQAIPEQSVTARVSATDWVDTGWDVEQTIAFAQALESRGCDAIHVSSGGLHPAQSIPVEAGYQVPLASAVKRALTIPVIAVGLITDHEQAEAIIRTGHADLIALARAMLYNPRWPWHAAARLGAQVQAPPQYLRSQPRQFPELFGRG